MTLNAIDPNIKYIETCSCLPELVTEKNGVRVATVMVDGSYHHNPVLLNGVILNSTTHGEGKSYSFSMKLSSFSESIKEIYPSRSSLALDVVNQGKKFTVSLMSDESGESCEERIKTVYHMKKTGLTPYEEGIKEIAQAIIEKRQPAYSESLVEYGIRDLSVKILYNGDIVADLAKELSHYYFPAEVLVELVDEQNYPAELNVPEGAALCKVMIQGEGELYFDLGTHETTPIKIYFPIE